MSRNAASLRQFATRASREKIEGAVRVIEAHPRLEALAYAHIEDDEARDIWRLDAWPVSPKEEAVLAKIARDLGLAISIETLADADWLALSHSGLPPVIAGRFFVFGAHDRGAPPANAVRLRIDAGLAFGTGHHASTVGCLLALDDLLRRRGFHRVLDIGTGTGILAIAAALTGAVAVLGVDIDPVAVRVARENARINGARARFSLASGPRRPVRASKPFDLILANILAAPISALAPQVRGLLRRGGRVILSGVLTSQARFVAAAYLARGFRLERRLSREAWATLTLRL